MIKHLKEFSEGGPGSGRYPAGSGKNPQSGNDNIIVKDELFKVKTDDDNGSIEIIRPMVGRSTVVQSNYDSMVEYDSSLENLDFENPYFIESIEVNPDYQGKGYGSEILKKTEKEAKKNGADGIYLNASPIGSSAFSSNERKEEKENLIKFYKKNGYTVANDEGTNAVMYKSLKDKKESAELKITHLKEHTGQIRETKKDEQGKITFPVVIISQGLGNLADKNYYSAQAIKEAALEKVYEGKKAYFDHPTSSQSQEQPGRSVREIAGYYKNTRAEQDEHGMWVLKADLVPIEANTEVMGLLTHAIEYKKEFPDKELIGISINGDGEGKTLGYEEFLREFSPTEFEMKKISQVDGQPINAITKLTSAMSADLVTEAGARGRMLLESKKIKTKKRRTQMLEAMKKFLFGAEKNDKKLMEEAAELMLKEGTESEAEKEDMEESKHAESLSKAMLNCKKEMKKYEDESEAEYETRCMKQAMKQMKKEAEAEAKKHEDKSKKESDKKNEPADEKKEGEKIDDKAAAAAKADPSHPDAAQDVDLIKKLMGEMEEMKKEMASMKQSKKEAEAEAKKHHEESANAKIELEAKKRAEKVDKILRESGLPRYATDNLRDLFLTKVRSDDEMKKMVETAKEVHTKAIESAFFATASKGFTEIATDGKETSNDYLF